MCYGYSAKMSNILYTMAATVADRERGGKRYRKRWCWGGGISMQVWRVGGRVS